MKDLPKTWVSSNNHLKILDQKNQKFQSCYGEQNKGNTRPQMQKLSMDHVTRKKLKQIWKKHWLKLLELCKTRTKKSSPDLFNFHVVLAGHDMVTDADRWQGYHV